MNHTDIRHKLSEYMDNAVTPAEKAAIEDHLRTCSACADALAELRKTVEHIHSVEELAPPGWMTSKIMAKVREEAAQKKSFFRRFFFPLAVKVPLQAVAVLFLAVTAFYIYEGMHPEQKYAEAPMEGPAKKEAPFASQEPAKQRAAPPERREKKVEQAPGYRSLDMKDEYEKPAPPAPAVPAEEPALAAKAGSVAPRAMMAKPAAPPVMAEQAAGDARSSGRKQSAASEGLLEKKALGDLRAEDRETEERLAITEHFVSRDLQEAMQVKGLQFITRRLPDDLAGLEWLREMKAYRSVPCTRRYIVDVEVPGRSLKYLYCYERSKIRRLGIFELISGVWMELN